MEQIIQKYSITNFFIQDLTITIIEGSQEIMSLLKRIGNIDPGIQKMKYQTLRKIKVLCK